MAKKHIFDAGVDLKGSEIANVALQNLFIFPPSPSLGQILFRSDLNLGAYWDGTVWLFFGLSENVLAALNAANSPDGTNPFLTLDDLPVLVEDFIDLFDVPNAYTGAGLKTVRVKATEDGLEFFLIVGIPAGGTTGQVLGKVSDDDYHVTWIDQTGGGGGGGESTFSTSNTVKFDKLDGYIHGTKTTPISGSISFDFTDIKLGALNYMIHAQTSVLAFPASASVVGTYSLSENNYIGFLCIAKASGNEEILVVINQKK